MHLKMRVRCKRPSTTSPCREACLLTRRKARCAHVHDLYASHVSLRASAGVPACAIGGFDCAVGGPCERPHPAPDLHASPARVCLPTATSPSARIRRLKPLAEPLSPRAVCDSCALMCTRVIGADCRSVFSTASEPSSSTLQLPSRRAPARPALAAMDALNALLLVDCAMDFAPAYVARAHTHTPLRVTRPHR